MQLLKCIEPYRNSQSYSHVYNPSRDSEQKVFELLIKYEPYLCELKTLLWVIFYI